MHEMSTSHGPTEDYLQSMPLLPSRVGSARIKGKLVTYTIVHVAPTLFNHMAPYAVGIVEMPEEVRLPSIIRTSRLESLKIGMELELDFSPRPQDPSWPQWPRYFFKETA